MITWRYCYYVIFLIDIFKAGFVVGTGCPPPDLILPCRCLLKSGEYQVWCSHSDLPKVLNGLRSLSQHIKSPIDELILEHNFIPSLPGRTFQSLNVLRLMVRQNGLERLSPDWLLGLEEILMELFIVEPKLRYLPDESLRRLNVLEAITLQTNDLKRLPKISFLKKLRYIQIESTALSDIQADNFENLPFLEKILISGSRLLERLEPRQFENLPSLKIINITSCGLNWLHPRTFFNLPMINEISLVDNKIQDAGMIGRAIKDLSLEKIYLDFNLIKKLSEGTFVDIPTLKFVYLTFNEIVEIHNGAFRDVPSLKTLRINDNKVKNIHPNSLTTFMNNLEELWLAHNDLTQLNTILEISHRLIYLDLSFNKFEVIMYGLRHQTLENLNLNNNNLIQLNLALMPNLRELTLKNNKLTNFNLDLPSLKGLDISRNRYKNLQLKNLPLLRKLDASQNSLYTIDAACFKSTPLIEIIDLSRNNLKFLHPITFKHLDNLYELNLCCNSLEEFFGDFPKRLEYLHLHHNSFKLLPYELTFLKYLDFSNNFLERISNLKFPSLKKLYLKNNQINHIEEDAFENVIKLEILDLSGNKLTQINQNSFRNIQNLLELNLSNNNIQHISPEFLHKLPKLLKYDFSVNKLSELRQHPSSYSPVLETLNMSGNSLINIPLNIFKMKRLKNLDLSHNRLITLPTNAFQQLPELIKIKFNDNYIKQLETTTFTNLQKLKLINLANNNIDSIETNTFQSLPSLQNLKLTSNKIEKITSLTFNNITKLQKLNLEFNSLKFISHKAFNLVPNLLILNVSHNRFLSIDDIGLNGVTSLEVLDLSFNKIRKLDTRSFEKMEWLVEIKMDDNEICGIFGTPFDHMPRLRVISLKRNKLMRISEGILDRVRTNLASFDVDGNPIDCTSCNAIWLQAWAEETIIPGPHCSNGSPIRLLKSLPKDCRNNLNDITLPNCDVENFPHRDNFKNIFEEDKTNNLAPLPQESEYFYDDYVDFPFNETFAEEMVGMNHSSLVKPQKSSHIISGDTPTLYAATVENETKPDIPKEVPHSPSSSGFTFFGVPLPSLNKLLMGHAKRDGTRVADRKMAIMNKPFKATHSVPTYSPPAMETGGFVPILPGDGGFQPMTAPSIEIEEKIDKTPQKSIIHHPEPTTTTTSVPEISNITSASPTFTQKGTITKLEKPTTIGTNLEQTTSLNQNITEAPNVLQNYQNSTEASVEIKTTTITIQNLEKNETTQESWKISKNATPLSTLLVPNGHVRPAGRSTITKVESPFTSTTSIPSDQQLNNVTLNSEITNLDEVKENWYFANYNKTYSEPFHGMMPNCAKMLNFVQIGIVFYVTICVVVWWG